MTTITKTTVIGAGAMGHGIAQVFAQAGCRVALYDIDEETLNQAPRHIQGNLQLLAKKKIIRLNSIAPTLDRIKLEPDFKDAISTSELILEAVPERVDLKQDIFTKAEDYCSDKIIFATTTSVIRVGDIASAVQHPERVVGTHWMNPPFVLPLVEIIRGPKTGEWVIDQTRNFLEKVCHKRTVTCNDTPGFLVNRMAGAVLTEAAKLIEEGVATPVELDRAWKEHLGLVFLLYGPFGNLDFIGLDVVVLAAKYLAWALEDKRYTLPKWLEEKMQQGDLGVKTGKGFYDYGGKSLSELRQTRIEDILHLLRHLKFNE
jgi:3-hydroxyacyl-CoA dehydrogenase